MGVLQWESQWDVSFKLIKKKHTKEKWMEMINSESTGSQSHIHHVRYEKYPSQNLPHSFFFNPGKKIWHINYFHSQDNRGKRKACIGIHTEAETPREPIGIWSCAFEKMLSHWSYWHTQCTLVVSRYFPIPIPPISSWRQLYQQEPVRKSFNPNCSLSTTGRGMVYFNRTTDMLRRREFIGAWMMKGMVTCSTLSP